jgi:hypothetical protein
MKAQLALFEVLMCSIVMSAAMALLAGTMYLSPLTTGAYNPRYGDLLYDFSGIVYGNATMDSCFTSNDLSCGVSLMKALKSVYGMNYVSFSLGDSKVQYGSDSDCKRSALECLPIHENDTFAVACLYACGA